VTWLADHWLDLFGWAGSALLIVSLLQARVLRFRVLNLVAGVMLVLFNALIEVWPMVAMNLATSAINVWFIVKLLRDRHSDTAFRVLAVRSDDVYLGHVLAVHRADVVRHQPDFSWDGVPREDRRPFLVLKGDETVGVVIIRVDGEVAHVELDYVTRRFRDFSPGEFVWRESGVLRRLGIRRVVTSPSMVDPYYERVGFRREGASYVLAV
jgi:membrane protein implicated in regulation of membrane protease activity